MARFQLLEKHYLNVDNCEYEHKEEVQTRVRGRNRQSRKVYPVPMYLNPKDPADCNYGDPDRIIISTKEDRRYPDDYLIRGDFSPTLDMQPLDQEADAVMEEFRKNYKGEHPIESLSGSFAETVLDKFVKQLEALGGRDAHAVPGGAVSVAELDKLKSENASLNAKLDLIMTQLAAMTPSPSAPPQPIRRGV